MHDRLSPQRLRTLLESLGQGLLEREAAVRLVLLAALAGEHVLLIGPPGTAKSELARRLQQLLADTRYFERLLTRFSTPEELFGPLSLKALEDDRYERLTDGFLPTAGVAFLDEVFKANSAILNALLTLLNERQFDNGRERVAVPLVCVVAASNEVPVDEALRAFFDRFLLRVPVAPVGDDAFVALLGLPMTAPQPGQTLATAPMAMAPVTAAERAEVAAAARRVTLAPELVDACTALRRWLAGRGLTLSDRRWRQWMGLMRVAAAAEGRTTADAWDLWLAPYVASPSPEEASALAAWFEAEVAGTVAEPVPWLTRAVEAFERQLDLERSAPADPAGASDEAGKLALARAIGLAPTGEAMPRLLAERVEERLRRRFSPVHVAARQAQVAELHTQVEQALDASRQRLAARREALAPRLWMPPALVERLIGACAGEVQALEDLLARLEEAGDGFAGLPVDQTLTPEPPPAVTLPADLAA